MEIDKLHRRLIESLQPLNERLENAEKPPWLWSLVLHLAILFVLALITSGATAKPRISLTLGTTTPSSVPEMVEFSVEAVDLEEPEDFEEEIQEFDLVDASHVEVADVELPASEAEMPDLTPTTPAPVEELELAAVPSLEAMAEANAKSNPGDSGTGAASMFAGRTGEAKKRLLQQGGGTEETEKAVEMGLAWLKRKQHTDGGWSLLGPYRNPGKTENRTAATAMAMLAFMGAGHTHVSGEYKAEMTRALQWLISRQEPNGWMAQDSTPHAGMYAQAQATIALCELLAMTRDTRLIDNVQRACDFAAKAQSPQGGWRYIPSMDSDTSVTGWFLIALKSGKAAGIDVDPQVFKNTSAYLDTVSGGEDDYSGVYSYQPARLPSPSMTAEALLCRQYLGWHRMMPGMQNGLSNLVKDHPIDSRAADVYYWYYATQALHHFGGPIWDQWNSRMRVVLPESQVTRGDERGSWSPQNDAWGDYAGRLYTTCLSLYCLEVYYRHMPIYDPEKIDRDE